MIAFCLHFMISCRHVFEGETIYYQKRPSFGRSRTQKESFGKKRASLNTVLLEALEKEAGIAKSPKEHHDLDHFIGSWIADAAVDRALSEQRKIDPKDWQT